MKPPLPPRRIRTVLAVALAAAGLVAAALPAAGQSAPLPSAADYGFQGEGEARVRDLDARAGRVEPTTAQVRLAAQLGVPDVTWNAFGTPKVLFNQAGSLSGPRAGGAVDVARAFVRENAALFRLSGSAVDTLEVLRDSPLYDSPDLGRVYRDKQPPLNPDVAHSVMFRQRFGDLPAGLDGQLIVGVQPDGSVVWASSSVTGDSAVAGAQRLDAAQAIKAAAADVGMDLGALTAAPAAPAGFTTFAAAKARDVQRARLVALPTPKDGVRRAWEVTLLNSALDSFGNPTAFISFVDAETGRVWQRTSKVEHFAQGVGGASSIGALTQAPPPPPVSGQFSGTTQKGACNLPKDDHKFTVGAGYAQITVAAEASPAGADTDIVLNLYFGADAKPVASSDVLTSPEVVAYRPPGGVPAGAYRVEVCPYNGATAPPINYSGQYLASAGGSTDAFRLPTWKVFPANPPFVAGLQPTAANAAASTDTRVLWCWNNSTDPAKCAEQQMNTASRLPWDTRAPGLSTLTTEGNNASTAISEASFLTPDTAANRPVSPTRSYSYPWTNNWFKKSCDPASFGVADPVAGGTNDESAAVTNLFVQHNRMHDWSYYLGFTEVNYNLQQSNFGNTDPIRENDPELGSAQAGRRTVNGRDNANQITLQDGIAPITNQYLWQPLAGAFYSPCVDGAYDMAVVAHEYTHAITNRMLGGPDSGTGTTQGQTESWSDLGFAGYFLEFGISAGPGVNPLVLGPYVTGDPVAGIRNYAMNDSPLNYSDLDYDGNGLGSPHANGEIWSAVNYDILASLAAKYDGTYPFADKALQARCARGELPADRCPGNRRWNQIQFDSFLLQPSGVSMIDSRDAMLAADRMRFGGANQAELWDAFARRGLGASAKTTGPSDVDAVPGWDSPLRGDEAQVVFTAPAGVSNMQVFTGRYEARATPTADTDPATPFADNAVFVPGTYEFIARAPGFGAIRFTLTLGSNQRLTYQVPLRRNVASAANGATITGDGVNLDKLIDDTEATNWASTTSTPATAGKGEGQQVEGRQVTIDLAGDQPVNVTDVQVSAALRGALTGTPTPPDAGAQSRFSALRSFDILACNATAGADCTKATGYTTIFASPDDAFPAGRPRPRVPDLILRPFDVTDTMATHIRLVVRDSQCTGGPAYQGAANPDNDPNFNPDCDAVLTPITSPDRALLSPPTQQVRAAELQVFTGPVVPPATGPNQNPPINQIGQPGGPGTGPGGPGSGPGGPGTGPGGSGGGGPGSAGNRAAVAGTQWVVQLADGRLARTGGTPLLALAGTALLAAGAAMWWRRRA